MNRTFTMLLGLAAASLPGCVAETDSASGDYEGFGGAGEIEEFATSTQEIAVTDTVGSLSVQLLGCDGEKQRIRVSVTKEKFKDWDPTKQIITVLNFRRPDYSWVGGVTKMDWVERSCRTNLVGRRVCDEFSADYSIDDVGPIRVLAQNYESQDINSISSNEAVGAQKEAVSQSFSCKAEPDSVRLHHELSNQCLYAQVGNGKTVDHWQCWDDPNMRFVLDPVASGGYRLRHTGSGQCLYAEPQNGGRVRSWQCWNDPNMIFHLDAVSAGKVRLRHAATNKCVYVHGGNGQTTHVWDCWNDPNMVFTLDP